MTSKVNFPAHPILTHARVKPATIVFMLMVSLLCLASCGKTTSEEEAGDTSAKTNADDTSQAEILTILAGSELKDIEPLLPQIQQQTGVTLRFEYTGTLDGVNAISQGSNADAAWFSHGKYLSLANRNKIKAQNSIMLSPVIMGVKQSQADALGWLNTKKEVKSDITWEDIAKASQTGKLKYAMTNPSASNSGFTALMGVASAFAGTADAPTSEDIAIAKPKLKAFFRGQALTSGSSGWLADAYVKEQNELDAIINYESVLIQLNESGRLNEPLVMVYPKEGIVTADYPLTLLNFDEKDSYDKVVAYLKSEDVQRQLMTDTKRRPVINQVKLDNDFYSGLLVELPFPNSLRVIDDLLIDFANELRNPTHSLFLLDVSGSMQGNGITQLRQALLDLSGKQSDTAEQTLGNTGRFTQFAKNEIVSLKPFNHQTYEMHSYAITEQNLPKLRQDVNGLQPKGGTAIYSALANGYDAIFAEQQKYEAARQSASSTVDSEQGTNTAPFYYSIVLMTDGISEDGMSYNDFEQAYKQMPAEQQHIKTFVVLFGGADEAQMQKVANLTGGRVFDGRNTDLTEVFRKIRGYQ